MDNPFDKIMKYWLLFISGNNKKNIYTFYDTRMTIFIKSKDI